MVAAQMKILEVLGVKGAEAAACVTAHDYLSERSAALLLRPRPDQLDIGSAVAIEIGGRRTTFEVWILRRSKRYLRDAVWPLMFRSGAQGPILWPRKKTST